MDDILIVGFSPQDVEWAVRTALQTLMQAGYIINLKKSDLTPAQDLVYIGGQFQMDLARIFLPEARKDALICAPSFRKVGSYRPAHQFLRLLGLMAATLPGKVVQHHSHAWLKGHAGISLSVKTAPRHPVPPMSPSKMLHHSPVWDSVVMAQILGRSQHRIIILLL